MAAAQYYEQIQEAYVAYYGRPADPAGQAYWANQLAAANGNMDVIIDAFGNSAESTSLYGGSNTAAQVIAIYQTLFGRAPDTAGLNYYVNGISTGQFSLASVALNVYNGAQGDDATALTAKLAYADAFTAALTQSVSGQAAYTGTAASNNARTALGTVTDSASEATAEANLSTTVSNIGAGTTTAPVTLTTGVDTIVGANGNNTFNAVLGSSFISSVATLNPFDSITGGSGVNTLNIADSTAASIGGTPNDVIPSGVTLSNIQNINLSTTVNAGNSVTQTFDVSGVSGLQNLTVVSGNIEGDFIKAATTTNVTDTTGAGSYVAGGNAVTITANVAAGATGGITVVGAAGAVTITDKGDASLISVQGGTTVNVTGTADSGNVAIGSAVTLNPAGKGLSAATLAAAPTGNVTVNESTTVEGVTTFGTGLATIYTNGATSVSLTGTGNVVGDTITDIQSTQISGAAVGTSTLASVTLDGVSAGVTINSDALTSLTVLDSDDNLTFGTTVTVNNANAHALALTVGENLVTGAGVDAPTTEFATVTDATATSATVSTTGALPADVTLTLAAATSLTFNNAAAVTLDDSSSLAKVATITATGAGAVDLGDVSGLAKLVTVDASSAAGAVTAEISGAQVFKGGAGGAVVTLESALTTTSGGSITFGSGNNSLLSDGGSIGNGVTVDGGSGDANTISASLVNAGATIKDFQIVDVSGYNSQTLDTAFALSTAVTGVAISTVDSTGSTLQNLADNVTITYSNDDSVTEGSDLILTHASGAGTLTVNFADQTAEGYAEFNTLTSTGDTAISIVSGGATGNTNYLGALNETDNHLTKITITGANFFELQNVHTNTGATTATANVASSLTAIDASGTTGGVWIEAGSSDQIGGAEGAYYTTYTGLTIKGGTGGDTIVNGADKGVIVEGATAATTATHEVSNVLTVAGAQASINDTASAADDTINLSGVSDSATLGSGTVTVYVESSYTAHTGDTTTVTFGTGAATINDGLLYNGGNMLVLSGSTHGNTLVLSGAVLGSTATLGTAADVSGQTFAGALTAASSATTGGVTWFQAGGNTYVEVAGAAHATAELVKITGNVDLSHATLDAGGLHFA